MMLLFLGRVSLCTEGLELDIEFMVYVHYGRPAIAAVGERRRAVYDQWTMNRKCCCIGALLVACGPTAKSGETTATAAGDSESSGGTLMPTSSAGSSSGSTGDSGDATSAGPGGVEGLCERLILCGAMVAVEECVATFSTCGDVEAMADECLKSDDCGQVAACYLQIALGCTTSTTEATTEVTTDVTTDVTTGAATETMGTG